MSDPRRIVRLSKMCTKISDGTHHSPKVQLSEPGRGRFKYVTSKNLRPWGLDLTDIAYVTEDIHREIYDRCNPELGDVLLTKDGANTGMVAINILEEEFSLLSSVALLKPDRSILEPRYLRYFLESPEGTKRIAGKMTGTAIRRIILKHIKDAEMPLVPLPEQKEIVAKIEKQFTRLEAGVAALRRVQANLKRYRASVLKAACEGRLVSGNLKKWRQIALGEIVESMKNGIYKPRDAYIKDGVACLRMYNIENGKIVWRDIKRMRLSHDEIKEYGLLPGDVLVNRVNSRELVGKAAVIPNGLEACVFESKNIRVRIKSARAEPRFVNFALSANGSTYFNRNAQQVVGMASISQPQVAGFPLSLPPLAEQTRIVAEVERRLSVADQLEAVGVANLQRAARLRQSILQKAFSGNFS